MTNYQEYNLSGVLKYINTYKVKHILFFEEIITLKFNVCDMFL